MFEKNIIFLVVSFCFVVQGIGFAGDHDPFGIHQSQSRITDDVIPLQIDKVPARPRPLIELGESFLDVGPISQGFTLPTGAVWQPAFLAWGNFRTAVQGFYDGDDYVTEWANRFDLYGNLYLTPTERFLIGFRTLDRDGQFTGYTFESPNGDGSQTEENFDITTLFFEGDFGEIFPFLDKEDKHGLDFAFSIGRQPISFQDGMLINDSIDAIGISKINLRPPHVVNMRSTVLAANNEINRTNLSNDDGDSILYGSFNEIDFRKNTLEIDAIYIDSNDDIGDGYYFGLGSTQRIGNTNTTFRVLSSFADGMETDHNAEGTLLFGQASWTPHGTDNLIYLNGFRGFDNFRSASRGPSMGGPLSPAGILFEAVGLGRYSSPLSNAADEVFGGSLGLQLFFDDTRKQVVLELGGRYATNSIDERATGLAARYQMAIGRRTVLRLDSFATHNEDRDLTSDPDEFRFGGRIELMFRF